MKQNWDKILKDFSYKCKGGAPDLKNPIHLQFLRESLLKFGWNENAISEFIGNLREKTLVKNVETGNEYLVKNVNKEKHKVIKKNATEDDLEKSKKDGAEDQSLDQENDSDEEQHVDSSVALEKLNHQRWGVEVKIDAALERGYIEQGDADNMKEFHSGMEDFLKNPTREKAEAIVEKYKLSQNPSGTKLYVGIIAGNGRKILGVNNALVREVGDVLNQYVPLKEKGDIQRMSQNKLQSASKPGLKTIRTSTDPGVRDIFSIDPFSRLKGRFHQVFGPVDDKGNILKPSSEYSTKYFRQSVNENESLDKTIQVLKELEEEEMASPGVRSALEKHKQRMGEIAKKYDKMSPEERVVAVEKSYSDMATEMHTADPDITRGLMKNMSEMALYDSELAAGDEVYLPSDGSFPSADKIRINRDGSGVVEKVIGVSVKFGKHGAVYGFPGESAQYQKFHPNATKRDFMKNRVGHKGHALGVRDDLIDDKNKFDKMLDESGLFAAVKDPEKVRAKFLKIQKKINELRYQIENENGKYTNKDLVQIRKQLESTNREAITTLKENIDVEELEKIIGKSNAKEFMKGGAHAINIISMSSILRTSNGLSALEHNHQTINDSGLHSQTERGTSNLSDWNFSFRGFDIRGGGLLVGFVGDNK